MTYDRRLRLHRLIARIPNSNTYFLTPQGGRSRCDSIKPLCSAMSVANGLGASSAPAVAIIVHPF